MEFQMVSKTWTINYLFELYKKRLIELKGKNTYSDWEILDGLVILHYCLEFQINEFFRDWFLFCVPEKLDVQVFIHKRIDKISFLDKVTIFLYTNEQIGSTVNKKSLISRVINFCKYRNTIFHGNELDYYYEDENSNSEKWPSYNESDFLKQIWEYENILKDFACFSKYSSSFYEKWHDERIDLILKSIFSK